MADESKAGSGNTGDDDGVVALLQTARDGSGESVAKLADAVGVNSIGTVFVEERQRTTTALYEAVDAGNADVVNALLQVPGIDVNIQPTKFHRTALGLAADYGDVGLVSTLLGVDGVDVNAGADGLGSPLVLATIKGRTAVVALLLESPDVNVNQYSRNKIPPLTEAIRLGHTDIVDLLLQDERVDTTQLTQDDQKVSAFALACRMNCGDVVSKLLQCGRFDVGAETQAFDLMSLSADDSSFKSVTEQLDEFFLQGKSFEELGPEEQTRKMYYVFRKFDTDATGFLKPDQLGALASELGVELSESELREAVIGLDTNRNGLIEFEELTAYWTFGVGTAVAQ